MVFANTILATAAAALAWSFAEWIHRGTPTMLGAASGAVAGLVAITPACGWVGPMGSIAIGLVAGLRLPAGRGRASRRSSATTTRSTCSACTASAASSARC